MKASMIIPTYNRRQQLQRVLDAVARQEYDLDAVEVLVISDGSQDGTESDLLLRARSGPLRLRPIFQENQGVAASRNRGLEEACGELVIFLDDDVVPRPGMLRAHFAAHARYGAGVVVLGPLLTPVGHTLSPWVAWEQRMLDKQYNDMVQGNWQATARQFYTGNVSLRRSALLEAGGFDPSLRRGEDVELGYRLAQMGLRFVFEPEAAGDHYANRSYESWLAIPYAYGLLDVNLANERGHQWLLPRILYEFHERNPLVRGLVRLCLDRPGLSDWISAALDRAGRASHAWKIGEATRAAYSGIFNLRYYQGVADSLGGRECFFDGVAANIQATGSVPGVLEKSAGQGGQSASRAI